MAKRIFHPSPRRLLVQLPRASSTNPNRLVSGFRGIGFESHHARQVSSTAGKGKIPPGGATTTTPPTPRPLFPWRSEGSLVPRLMPGTKEYQTLVPLPASKNSENITAWLFLKNSFWSSFLTHKWKRDLEQGITYAFTRAIAGIVSNVYRIPMNQIFKDDIGDNLGIAVDFSYPPQQEEKQSEVNHKTPSHDDSYCNDTIYDMMIPELQQLFQSAHESGVQRLRIRLHVIPTQTFLVRLHSLPFLTRSYVQDINPSILQDNCLVDQANDDNDDNKSPNKKKLHFEVNSIYGIAMASLHHQNRNPSPRRPRSSLETTIAAEVLVECQEVFTVWDAETGQVLQGYDDTNDDGIPQYREVAHVVMVEQTTLTQEASGRSFFPSLGLSTPGDWQITDIDDLLGPKKWFHIVLPSEQDNNTTNVQTAASSNQ